jgi:hypothetical protein
MFGTAELESLDLLNGRLDIVESACPGENSPLLPNVDSDRESIPCAYPSQPIHSRWGTLILLLAVLSPAIISFGVLYSQPLSVPYQDDYNAILSFAIDYKHMPNLWEKVLDIAAAQHNEYKLGFEHAVVASELELYHDLNFGFLVALGDCFLLGIGYLLWKTYSGDDKDLNLRLLKFLPISLVFFSFSYWENLNWAMTGLQNTPVIFFSLCAIYLLIPAQPSHPSLPRMVAACAMGALASFTSANGFLLVPIGLLFLLPRRDYGRSLMWCASFVVPLAAYLYHYQRQAISFHKFYYLTRPLFFFSFLGCTIPFRYVALFLGIGIVAVILLAICSRFDRINPVAFYFTLWAAGTGLLVAWVRGAVGFGIASRYSLYSVLSLTFCYSFLGQYLPVRFFEFNRRRFYAVSLVLAFGFWLMADIGAYRKLEARRHMVLRGIEFYRAAPGINSPMIDPEVEKNFPKEKAFEHVILTKAIQEGIYTLPPRQQIH